MDTVEYLHVSRIRDGTRQTYFDDTSTLTGLFKLARCSLATFVVMVAEKRYVFRSLGITFRILSMMGPKSISSNLSASSMICMSAAGPLTVAAAYEILESLQRETLGIFQVVHQSTGSCDDDMRSF